MLFGIYFCINGYVERPDGRLITSLLGEIVSLCIWLYFAITALNWLQAKRWNFPAGRYDTFVLLMSCVYLTLILVNLFNADTSGLLSKGGKLDFYRENDWYRRLVTFSYVPSVFATFHSVYMLLSPVNTRRKGIYLSNIFLMFLSSLLSGSKGSAILVLSISMCFVFPMKRINVAKIGFALAAGASMYSVLFLLFTSDPLVGIFDLFHRFYLSIDMSILLQDRGAAMSIADRLNDVWIEAFRNSAALGARVASSPIGSLVYEATINAPVITGANCRFASLLLIYPDRFDFLIGYPALVVIITTLLCNILRTLQLSWFSVIAAPIFIFQSFQDVYWFTTHVLPIVIISILLFIAKASTSASFTNNTYAEST